MRGLHASLLVDAKYVQAVPTVSKRGSLIDYIKRRDFFVIVNVSFPTTFF